MNINKKDNQENTIENALSSKRRINKKKINDENEEETEEEWKIAWEVEQSEDNEDDEEIESNISMVSDYIPDGYNNIPRPQKIQERKSIFELFKEFKYKKIQKASKESYLKLNEGIVDGDDELFDENNSTCEDIKAGDPTSVEAQLIEPDSLEIWDLLPFSPPIYKCIRLPKHLKWITIHHSTVSSSIFYNIESKWNSTNARNISIRARN